MPRHRHSQPFATVVLSGVYVEAGDTGRRTVTAGDVILHDAYHAHFDRFDHGAVTLLNLPVPVAWRDAAFGRCTDPDRLVWLAQRDPQAAAAALKEDFTTLAPDLKDWPDRLAQDLISDPRTDLGRWAIGNGLHPAALGRGFRRRFGVGAAAFRAAARARLAVRLLRDGDGALADVAMRSGHADQSHMTRAVLALTGQPPARFRRWQARLHGD